MDSRRSHVSNDTAAELFSTLVSYDAEFLRRSVSGQTGMPPAEFHALWAELMRFVALCDAGGKRYPMLSPDVDGLWHAFILHTERYMSFCEERLHRYFHHHPHSCDERAETSATEFIEDYEKAFGFPVSPVWHAASDCSSCGGSGCSH